MSRHTYLVAKAERDLRETVRQMPRVEVSVVKPASKKSGASDAKIAVLSGSAGTVLTLAGKKVAGEAVNAAGKKVWNPDTRRWLVRHLRRTA